MQFLTDAEAAAWARGRTLLMPFGDRPERQPRLPSLRSAFPLPAHRLVAFSSSVASAITDSDHAAAFCSHDEFVECYARSPDQLAEIRAGLARMNIEFQA